MYQITHIFVLTFTLIIFYKKIYIKNGEGEINSFYNVLKVQSLESHERLLESEFSLYSRSIFNTGLLEKAELIELKGA